MSPFGPKQPIFLRLAPYGGHFRVLDLHPMWRPPRAIRRAEPLPQPLDALDTVGAVTFVSPRAETWQCRKSVSKSSSPIWLARGLLAMFSRSLAVHFRLMLCYCLTERRIAVWYHAGRRWPQRFLNRGLILGGFSGVRSISVSHDRSRRNRRYAGLCRRGAYQGQNYYPACGSTYCTRDQRN
jgi:hypothetical protein